MLQPRPGTRIPCPSLRLRKVAKYIGFVLAFDLRTDGLRDVKMFEAENMFGNVSMFGSRSNVGNRNFEGVVGLPNQITRKILVVDDEPDLVVTCARLLKRLGYDCITANSVPEAIQLIDEHHLDLVVTDLHLPIGDGFEISRHVRRSRPKTPVILITAFHTPDTVGQALANGVTAYLAKPFSTAEFNETVQHALETP